MNRSATWKPHWATLCSSLALIFLMMGNVLAQTVANVPEDIQAYLDRQEFDEAIQKVSLHDGNQDRIFGKIALAQAHAGSSDGAKDTLRRIADVGSLAAAASEVRGATGGASGADFDTLINLITSTVAPNTWDDVGGPGAIESFDGGVYIDARGVLRKAKTQKRDKLVGLNLKLEAARDTVAAAHPSSDDQATLAADARKDSQLRMVSLTRLQRELQLKTMFGEAPTEEMKWLAGLREVQYLFLFPETNDVVVAGPAGDWESGKSPGLLLDDLLTLMASSRQNDGKLGCDISPKRENLAATQRLLATPTGPLKPRQTPRWVDSIRQTLGLQDITIRGVDPQSHVAHVMVEADYHMKLVGMGLEPGVPGVESYLASIESDEIPQAMQVLRWWFTLRDDAVRKNEKGDAYVFRKQVLRLQSENERVSEDGQRAHTGESSALNQLFASRFTKHFKSMSAAYPVYARLEGIFRLSMLCALLDSDEVQQQVDWDPGWLVANLKTGRGAVPTEVGSIVNHRVINRRHVIVGVSGGVTVDAATATRNVALISNGGGVASDHAAARPRDARHSQRWWWD